jgi:hypothetical protein
MGNYSRVLLLAVSLVAMAGCGFLGGDKEDALPNDPAALALLQAALDNQEAIQTAHVTLKQHISAPGIAIDVNQEIDAAADGRFYSRITGPAGQFELAFDGVSAFVRPEGGTWVTYKQFTGMDISELGVDLNEFAKGLDHSRFFSGVAFAQPDGEGPERRVRATLDAEAFFDEMLESLDPSSVLARGLLSASDMRGTVEYRLAGNIVTSALVDLTYKCNGQLFKVTTETVTTRVNEPVSFPSDLPIKL